MILPLAQMYLNPKEKDRTALYWLSEAKKSSNANRSSGYSSFVAARRIRELDKDLREIPCSSDEYEYLMAIL